jgi:hypothetical protein
MPFILDGLNIYAAEDKKYTVSARAATIKRFGPPGSLKKKNSILEQMMAVAAKIINEIFFDLKYGFVMLLPMFIRRVFSQKYIISLGIPYLYHCRGYPLIFKLSLPTIQTACSSVCT